MTERVLSFPHLKAIRIGGVRLFMGAVLLIGFLIPYPELHAGGSAENVFLVVNENSPSSKLVANHYIDLRGIPSKNVIYLKEVPNKDAITLTLFKSQILEPILKTLVTRKLERSIDYIVYSTGFPTRVSVQEHFNLVKDSIGERSRKLYSPVASLTSMTYFAGKVLQDNPNYMTLNSNRYYRGPYSRALVTPFVGELLKKYQDATAKIHATGEEFTEAQNTLLEMAKNNPGQAAVLYQLARFYAVEKNKDKAITYLTGAIAMGWRDRQFIERDRHFEDIKTDPLFTGIVGRISVKESNTIPTRGFRNAYHWAPNGMINGPRMGERYFLSSVLSVTKGQGISDYDTVNFLSRAANADFTSPQGTFYFTKTKDPRSTTRTPNFAKAINQLEGLGYRSRITKQVMPQRRDDVLGLTCGVSKFNWEGTGCRFVPGAIADNLTSVGGLMTSKSQTKCTEFLKYGAAGACGTVTEPYAIQQKFPQPLIHAHYVKGCSLAEAFYQSVEGPYQILLVGDPLCQPFAKPPKFIVTSPTPMQEIQDNFKIEIDDSTSPTDIVGYEIYVDGVLIVRTRNIEALSIDPKGIPDGFHEVRVVAVATNAIETRGHVTIPVIFNNDDRSVTIKTEQLQPNLSDSITVTATTNFGDRIIIKQNQKTVGVISSQEGSTTISARNLGMGRLKLTAHAISDSDRGEANSVSSVPLVIAVQGTLARTPRSQ